MDGDANKVSRRSCRHRRWSEPVDAAQDVGEQGAGNGDLRHLEGDVAPVPNDLAANLDQSVPERRQRPVLDGEGSLQDDARNEANSPLSTRVKTYLPAPRLGTTVLPSKAGVEAGAEHERRESGVLPSWPAHGQVGRKVPTLVIWNQLRRHPIYFPFNRSD